MGAQAAFDPTQVDLKAELIKLHGSARVFSREAVGTDAFIDAAGAPNILNDVIAMANDTTYGLSATILTENLSRAHRVGGQIEAGLVWVNSWFLRDLRTSFGGSKSSGIGREGGLHSLEFYTERSNLCMKL